MKFPAFPLVVLCAGCTTLQSVLEPAGPQAETIRGVWETHLAVSVVVFVAVMVAVAWTVVRRRAVDAPPASRPPLPSDPVTETKLARSVAAAVGATVVVLFGLLVANIAAGRTLGSLTASDPMVVRVIGHQWWWEVQYDNGQPSQLVTSANEVHVPVGRPVTFQLESRDVIHSFWIPALHGKRDMIPGYTARIVLEADRAGTYRGQCAEFCGYQHANMALVVIAEAPGEFAAWLARQHAPAPAPEGPSAMRGADVFMHRSCALCHAVRGTEAASFSGPDLTHVASRTMLAAGTIPNTRDQLARWITDPQGIKPGTTMPANVLPAAELNDLLDYLGSLR